jgi:hypothetical protein
VAVGGGADGQGAGGVEVGVWIEGLCCGGEEGVEGEG